MKNPNAQKTANVRSFCVGLLALAVFGLAPATAPGALILRYNFDEVSGDALDLGAAPSAPGVFTGQAGRTNDTPNGTGYALDVLGSNNANNNYVAAGNPDKLNDLTNGITLTWWMNLKALPATSDRVMEKLSSSAGFGVRFGASTTLSLGVNTTSAAANSPPVTNLNAWIFCAVTYDGSKTSQNAQWFIGSLANPAFSTGPVTYNRGQIANTPNAFRVGSTPATTNDRTPPAWFDDVRVYGSVLSVAEIEQIRLEGGGTAPATPSILGFQSDAQGYLTPGSDILFTATVLGQPPLTVLWQRNGIPLLDGLVTANSNLLSLNYTVQDLVPDNAGLYTLLVTNASGSVTSAPIAINLTTIYSTEVLTNLWTLEPIYFYLTNSNAERGLAYSPVSSYYAAGSLLVAHYVNINDFGIAVLNAENGSYDGYYLPITDGGSVNLLSGTRYVNLVGAAADGAIYVGNLTTSATNANGAYFLYRYDSDSASASPTIAYTGDPGGPNYPGLRWGDNLAVRGSGPGTEILIAPAGDLTGFLTWQTNIVSLLRTTDGKNFTPTVIWITNGPTAFANVGLAFGPGTNTFFAKQINAPLRLMEFDAATGLGWVKYEYDLDAVPGCVSAVALSPDGSRLGALSVETPDNFRFYGITDFARTPELLDQEVFPLDYPNLTSGGLGAVAFGTNGTIYVLDSANGIKAFARNTAYSTLPGFQISSIVPTSQGMAISWPTLHGRTYQALASDSLSNPRWVRVGLPVTGDGSDSTVTNRILEQGTTARFYRIQGQ